MFKTQKADWYFIIPASIIWLVAMAVTGWDFIVRQNAVYSFGLLNLIGAVAMITGVAIRAIARRALGKHFSYALRMLEHHALVTQGIYAHVRHPAYSGDLLFQLGTPLLFSSGYGFLVMLLLIPCISYRIGIEERMLVETFGDEYREYMRRSKKLIPFIY